MGEGENDNKVPFTLALVAGGIAGTTVDVVMYPLDTLKTRLQVRVRPKKDACGRGPPSTPHERLF